MADAPADLEGTLDRLIGRLTKAGAPREAKALLLDARRLRTLVGNWRTISPPEEARKEMGLRVEQLARSVEAAMPPDAGPPPEPAPARAAALRSPAPSSPPPAAPSPKVSPPPAAPKPRAVLEEIRPGAIAEPYARHAPQGRSSWEPTPGRAMQERRVSERPPARSAPPPPRSAPPPPRSANEWDEPPSLVVPVRSLPQATDEPTRAAPLATMVHADEERATARAVVEDAARANGAGEPHRPRSLPDLDISGIAQLLDDGHSQGFDDTLETNRPTAVRVGRPDFEGIGRRSPSEPPRQRPSPTPANGRRRAEPGAVDPAKGTGRVSRFLVDPENEPGANSAQVVPGASDDVGGRVSPRPSSAPPVAARSEKTLIAVRPLPAPEVLDKRLVMLTDPLSARADAYRALRRKLSGPGAPRTIAITSALPDEGKTSCAVNLALAFRETSSEKVLLLEANLRAPALAKLFGFEPPVCFAKQMARNRDSARVSWTVAEQFDPLHVLAVDPSSKTSPLLDPVAFANALEQLVEAGYDHIIVDTPPALGGSDVNLIADAVDGIVVVAWIKKSKRSLVRKAIEQLKPATILGVVTLEG